MVNDRAVKLRLQFKYWRNQVLVSSLELIGKPCRNVYFPLTTSTIFHYTFLQLREMILPYAIVKTVPRMVRILAIV